MKQPKRLTRNQKIRLSKKGYNPDEYGFLEEVGNTEVFINLNTKDRLVMPKK